MTNKETLILDITNESQTEVYGGGNQRVAFYDGFKAGKSALYLYVRSVNDRNFILKRRAGVKIINGQEVCETKLYARAYNKYLELKALNKSEVATPVVKLEPKSKSDKEGK